MNNFTVPKPPPLALTPHAYVDALAQVIADTPEHRRKELFYAIARKFREAGVIVTTADDVERVVVWREWF